MVWNANYPLPTSGPVCGSTEQIRNNWVEIEKWWNVEHHTLSAGETLSGQHTTGVPGVLLVSTTSGISSITSPTTGSIAFDTNKGELQRYTPASAWNELTSDVYSRVRYGFSSMEVTAGAWRKMTTATSAGSVSGCYDTIGEMATATDKVTLSGAGYYLIHGLVNWDVSEDCILAAAIYKNGSAIAVSYEYGDGIKHNEVFDAVQISAADYIELYVYNSAAALLSATATLHITRVS